MIRTPHRPARAAVAVVAGLALAGSLPSIAHADPTDAAEQIVNGSFDAGTAPWWWTGNTAGAIVGGQLCADVPAGTTNAWDVIIGQNDLRLRAGQSYAFSFTASASQPVSVRANVQLADPPYTAQLSQTVTLDAAQRFSYAFTSDTDTDRGQVAFQIGGAAQPWTFCVDDVSLAGGEAPPPYVPDTGPRVRVNQVGYLPYGPKRATVVTDAAGALPWRLKNGAGAVVASGTTKPAGTDAASGQRVQTVDFSGYTKAGSGYTLTVDGQTSYPFDISATTYDRLRSDSLHFFYVQRSGIAIDGALAPGYARPAGHVGVAPNQGDTDVPCQAGVCDYRLDVRGGWYDAGDHGKYVVNGGIATYQLLSEYERTLTADTARRGALGDGSLRVPERGNRVPDILDEARWELEFMLRMQVPAGQPLAGMVHHKVHDQAWTGLPLRPDLDPQPRELHPPSTAATLNLAATAAQCARLFAPYDRAFAARCLTAARTAWDAAQAHPAVYASPSDSNGGGAYDDSDVRDEFYWAAAELFITTGQRTYLDALRASPYWTGDAAFPAGGFGWQSVAAAGRLDLATVPNLLPPADRAAVRASVRTAAERYLAVVRGQAYGVSITPDEYVWGSNSNVLNKLAVIATAYDLTGDRRYRDGVLEGLDYLFGRNALNQSYVTGYGEHAAHNQHSRIYGHQLDPALPNPPAGSLAGGANSALQDPTAAKLLAGCAPQFCYIDDIQSYATNEVAINWNSALAWVSAFAADQRDGRRG
ncbi:glycoside hydrolase family 9 protein [Planosporangium sp. 12N6]|uniref:glycoside hydrolase family 9 protein n=1 Tax=Planosporangium spinosum TaxID=3402278 RepID=UPI003CEB2841